MKKSKNKNLSVAARVTTPTPPFFKKLRNIALVIGSVAASILVAPVALPAIVMTIAEYAIVACTAISAVSQVTTITENDGK